MIRLFYFGMAVLLLAIVITAVVSDEDCLNVNTLETTICD